MSSESNVIQYQQLQSATIDLLRFPLIIMVIFIHMNPIVINLIDADFNLLSACGFYNIMGITLSHVIAPIAVPTFFLMSGLLFFNNFYKWDWALYKKKIRRRLNTLIIPYIIWNLIPFLVLIIYMLLRVYFEGKSASDVLYVIQKNSWHIFYDCNEWGTNKVNWLGDYLRMTGPFNLPLWYLRDLIVVTLLSPLIYYATKKLKYFVLVVLFIAYISRIWTQIQGFSINAFFFFTLGAYFSIYRINVVSFLSKYRCFVFFTVLIFLPICVMYDGNNTIIGQNIFPFFIIAGVFTAILLCANLVRKFGIMNSKLLVDSCFFIFAFHTIWIPGVGNSPLGIIQMALHIIIPGVSILEDVICYVVSPFISAFVGVLLFSIARIIAPKASLLFSGR